MGPRLTKANVRAFGAGHLCSVQTSFMVSSGLTISYPIKSWGSVSEMWIVPKRIGRLRSRRLKALSLLGATGN